MLNLLRRRLIPTNDFLLHTFSRIVNLQQRRAAGKVLRFSCGFAQRFDFRLLLLQLVSSTQYFLLLIDMSSIGRTLDHVLIDFLCAGLHRLPQGSLLACGLAHLLLRCLCSLLSGVDGWLYSCFCCFAAEFVWTV